MKLSQASAARLLGMSARRFGHYCNDQREANYDLMVEICRVLKTHPNYLFGFDDNPELNQEQSAALGNIMDELKKITSRLDRNEDTE